MASALGRKTLRAWILDVGRWGDTQQMRTLAEATPGLEYDLVPLTPRRAYPKLRRFPRHAITWLDDRSRSFLAPPWPDVIFFAGRGAVSAALWVRRQHPATRLIAFGRPFAPLQLFDLVITTPPYFPPQRPNVLSLRGPLHILDPERLKQEREKWWNRLKDLPRPRIAVLVGGKSSPYRFAPEEVARLGQEISSLAQYNGGSLLVTVNRRVAEAGARILFDSISVPAYLHDSHKAGDNPYQAFLAVADAIVVTMDSLSMMTEAASTDAAVMIFPLEREKRIIRDMLDRLYDISMGMPLLAPVRTLLRAIEAQGVLLRRADRQAFAESLVRAGHAHWFSTDANLQALKDRHRPLDMRDELNRAVQRLQMVLHESR